TTDKPLYQPDQVIHLRALALRRPALRPEASRPLVFEVADAKGNKVFKQEVLTSAFGIASADFHLARELNRGLFGVKAILGDVVSEKKVTVDRYVLPKFRIDVTTERAYYRPGEVVRGGGSARYFFG